MFQYSPGIRGKLVGIFILIKVLPLMVLAWFAWDQIFNLADIMRNQVFEMVAESREVVTQVAQLSSDNSIRALDVKSRESIERLTTDTARAVAAFLYERDSDIEYAASLAPTRENFKAFLQYRNKPVTRHKPWRLSNDGTHWVPSPEKPRALEDVNATNKDNKKDFHYRPPQTFPIKKNLPLYLEMTYLDLDGKEIVKVTTSDRMSDTLKDVSKKKNTYIRSESYFNELKYLKPGEIYVSNVIGAYVKTHMIGPYTKARADTMGIDFAPEDSGYAGKENPAGRRFQGLVRWATPIVKNNQVAGYVTLALDHDHIMEFTDHIMPTEERYSAISDAGTGNYAFMWDYKSRCISHPRDYFIVGFDPETGHRAVSWLGAELYKEWKNTGLSISKFLKEAPLFKEQSLDKKPAAPLTKQGLVALDCRFLNFAPQCVGWHNITQHGGSGSFLIFWSGLWKLTTAAAIPYHTGQYGNDPRGFGFVTIGANVHEFHKAAVDTSKHIKTIESEYLENLNARSRKNRELSDQTLKKTATDLTLYTAVMILLVILIAIWMASNLTGRIVKMIKGVDRFKKGDMDHRLEKKSSDEMCQLAMAFNHMADDVQKSMFNLDAARQNAESVNLLLQQEVDERQKAEKELALHRDDLEALVKDRTAKLEKEISERTRVEKTMIEGDLRLRKQNETLLSLAGHKALYRGNLELSLRTILKSAAHTLLIEHAGVWLFTGDKSKIRCIERYTLKSNSHSKGELLSVSEHASFFNALNDERIVGVSDVTQDARTRGFTKEYFMKKDISSMLDVGIMAGGKLLGVVCLNHIGKPRKWEIDEQNFAGSIADLVSMAIETSEKREVERARKQLEVRLHRAEKMEAIGTLAGGVAHDLNNILSGIISYPELLLMQLPKDSRLRRPIKTILESGKRAAAIVQDLLTLARRGVTTTEVVNLNTIVMGYLTSPEYEKLISFHPGTRINTNLADNLLNISGSPVHLQKTIMNLVSNAVEAMTRGGVCAISTQNRYIDTPVAGYDDVAEGDYVVFTVSDQGVGISMEDISRIFEPFYTKKKMGRSGTGLGMAVVWGTVKDHKGYIDFKSEPGKGTVFNLYFPVTRRKADLETTAASMDSYRGSGETILVVDDVAEQREIALMILDKLGYKVHIVSCGEDAIEFIKRTSVDLMVLDMIMDPGIDGLDTYREIVKHNPDQKAIIASGYSETNRIKMAQRLGVGEYIKKPYSMETIGMAVKIELNR